MNDAAEQKVRLCLSRMLSVSKELACVRNMEACKQAQERFWELPKQLTAREEAVKALSGEHRMDLSIFCQMLLMHRV